MQQGYMLSREAVQRTFRGIRQIETIPSSGSPYIATKITGRTRNSVQFINAENRAIPPFGVLEVIEGEIDTADDTSPVPKVRQPQSSQSPCYLINDAMDVPAGVGEGGVGYITDTLTALYDPGVSPPVPGERWSATPGQYYLSRNPVGSFMALGGAKQLGSEHRAVFTQVTRREILLAQAIDAIATNNSGSLALLAGTPGSETATGVTVTAFNHFGEVKAGGKVLVLQAGENWYIAGGGGGSAVVAFELTEALEPGGTSEAVLEDDTPITVKDWTLSDPSLRGDIGFRGWAVPGEPDYLIVTMESYAPRIQCELDENMGQTTANRAYVVDVVGVGGRVPVLPPDVKLIVHDTQGLFKRALKGAKCEALYNAKEQRYEAVECQSKAGWVIFQAVETPSSETGKFDALIVRFGGTQQDIQDPPRLDSQGHMSISTEQSIGLSINDETYGYAILDVESDEYIAVKTYDTTEESGKLKVASTDSLQYLEEKFYGFNPDDIFNATTDLPIRFEVTNHNKVRTFVHGPDIAGYNGSVTQVLTHGPSGWQLMTIGNCP